MQEHIEDIQLKACYNLSQQLINEGSGYLTEAYNISETDIYDFCSEKMSLKEVGN